MTTKIWIGGSGRPESDRLISSGSVGSDLLREFAEGLVTLGLVKAATLEGGSLRPSVLIQPPLPLSVSAEIAGEIACIGATIVSDGDAGAFVDHRPSSPTYGQPIARW